MAGFFQRVFSLGSAEAHSIVDKLEDPVKMTEQGIRELKSDLEKAMQSFAEVKATQIRAQRDMEKNKNESLDWERKAMSLLQQGQSGKLVMEDADRLAKEALSRKEESGKRFLLAKNLNDNQSNAVGKLQKNIESLKSKIQQYENELTTLKARSKTAQATTKINKQLSSVDPKGTIQMLERMKQKVDEEEALAQAYGDIASINHTIDDEINQALLSDSSSSNSSQSSDLEALKAKMGIK
ncbi:MAG: PspA/IM30 family protein [Deltaproteobacteria bacterium]|nr:PspA/IM30 family protein [Deltaproteobacteria bacterium]